MDAGDLCGRHRRQVHRVVPADPASVDPGRLVVADFDGACDAVDEDAAKFRHYIPCKRKRCSARTGGWCIGILASGVVKAAEFEPFVPRSLWRRVVRADLADKTRGGIELVPFDATQET